MLKTFECRYCEDTGKYKQPKDEETYDQVYDRLFDGGQFSGYQAHKIALDKVGYTVIPCPHCNKGSKTE